MVMICSDKYKAEISVPLGRAFTHFIEVDFYHLIETVGTATHTNSDGLLEFS